MIVGWSPKHALIVRSAYPFVLPAQAVGNAVVITERIDGLAAAKRSPGLVIITLILFALVMFLICGLLGLDVELYLVFMAITVVPASLVAAILAVAVRRLRVVQRRVVFGLRSRQVAMQQRVGGVWRTIWQGSHEQCRLWSAPFLHEGHRYAWGGECLVLECPTGSKHARLALAVLNRRDSMERLEQRVSDLLQLPIARRTRRVDCAHGTIPYITVGDAKALAQLFACERCGYDLAGVTSARCPECGDVRLQDIR